MAAWRILFDKSVSPAIMSLAFLLAFSPSSLVTQLTKRALTESVAESDVPELRHAAAFARKALGVEDRMAASEVDKLRTRAQKVGILLPVAPTSVADLGDWLGASGVIMTTRKGELSVRVEDFVVLQKSLRPLPDKWHGLHDIELRSRRRYLDLMVNEEALAVANSRVLVVRELRRQFESRGFVEVETPVLLREATGANARPFATHHHALDMDMYLRIATELFLKRLVVGGMEKVFEIGRIFRNEGIDSTHNPEFTMLEAYQALADYTDMKAKYEMLNIPESFLLACEVTRQYVEENLGATEKIMKYCRESLGLRG